MFRYSTAGESHGKALIAVVEGIPCGVAINKQYIDDELARRQRGFGRGNRMKIETDEVEILSGLRFGKALGSPISVLIANQDWENWQEVMAQTKDTKEGEAITKPRPGHADLAGVLKTGQRDIRNVLERASARETAAKTVVGALAKLVLDELGISVISHVKRIGSVQTKVDSLPQPNDKDKIECSPVRCADETVSQAMVKEIEKAQSEKDSLGGVFEVIAWGVPPGLGSYYAGDLRLDGRLAKAVMSIPAIKGVEIGKGFELAEMKGSESHDEIYYAENKGYYRKTNRAGGVEGGMTNGEAVVIRAVMKPIPTIGKPLRTVDIATKEASQAHKERADICAVPSAAVISEAAVAIVLVEAVLDKFGGDSIEDLRANYNHYLKRIKKV